VTSVAAGAVQPYGASMRAGIMGEWQQTLSHEPPRWVRLKWLALAGWILHATPSPWSSAAR
jgi:hypothetical protein